MRHHRFEQRSTGSAFLFVAAATAIPFALTVVAAFFWLLVKGTLP